MTDPKKTSSLKNVSLIGSSDIIGAGITAFFWFYLATLMDAATYGELHYFIAIAGFAYTISMIGTRDVVTVYVSKKIKITSFGTFLKKRKNKRMGRNPKTKEEKIISARNVVTFKASKFFKDKINQKIY